MRNKALEYYKENIPTAMKRSDLVIHLNRFIRNFLSDEQWNYWQLCSVIFSCYDFKWRLDSLKKHFENFIIPVLVSEVVLFRSRLTSKWSSQDLFFSILRFRPQRDSTSSLISRGKFLLDQQPQSLKSNIHLFFRGDGESRPQILRGLCFIGLKNASRNQ